MRKMICFPFIHFINIHYMKNSLKMMLLIMF